MVRLVLRFLSFGRFWSLIAPTVGAVRVKPLEQWGGCCEARQRSIGPREATVPQSRISWERGDRRPK
jgi:hypothetical protein